MLNNHSIATIVKKNLNMINNQGRNLEDKINYIWDNINLNVNLIELLKRIHQVIQLLQQLEERVLYL